MRFRTIFRLGLLAVALLVGVSSTARAQSGIAGVVKDATGAVLPGVTIEAASPALIEKVRTVVSDEAGLYRIVDLRPGAYTVTFTLPGFSVFVRDGIELPADFTATVNGELKVGSIEESVTVSGQTPLVDMQNAAQQQILPRAVIDAVPTGKSLWAIGAMVPGVTLSGTDVGGSRGMQQLSLAVHGSDTRDNAIQVDGMLVNSFQDNVQQYFNDMMFEEMNYQTGAITAETSGAGVRVNMIPKEGGNVFKGTLYGMSQPGSWTGDNYTDAAAKGDLPGLSAPAKLKFNRDISGAIGGPVVKDRLWFFFSGRRWGVDQYINNAFENLDLTRKTWKPDLNSQVVDDNIIKSGILRLTYRTGQHKFASYLDRIIKWRGHECGTNQLEEACGVRIPRIYYTAQAKYTATLTNKLLFETGLSINNESFSTGDPQPFTVPGTIAKRELTGVVGGAPAGATWGARIGRNNRFPEVAKVVSGSLTYVTGSHAFKVGASNGTGIETIDQTMGVPGVNDLVQEYRVGAPASVVVYNTPVLLDVRGVYDIGIYVQDSWTTNRLTVTPGIRFEFFNSKYLAQTQPAGRFIGPRNFPEQPTSTQPHWKDWAPRIGAVYDLFGDSTTAVKGSWGKYVRTYHASHSAAYNPMTQTTDQRTWADLNGDDIAQGSYLCDTARSWNTPGCEIGPPNNNLFGSSAARRPEDGIKRPFNTEIAASIQRQLGPGMSASLAYKRKQYYREIITQNLAVQPLGTPLLANYTAVQVPNPIAAGETLTVYNLNPAFRGLVDDLDYNSDSTERTFDAWDIGFQSRVFSGTVFGGLSWGRQTLVTCDVRDPNYTGTAFNANGLRYCDQSAFGMPYRFDMKMSATYPLPYGFNVSGSFKNNPGGGATQSGGESSLNRNYNISAATFRTLTGQTLTQPSVIVRLLQPGTKFDERLIWGDMRFSKKVQIGKYSLQGQFDAFNLFNANAITASNQTHGTSYGNVTEILSGRVLAVGGTLTF